MKHYLKLLTGPFAFVLAFAVFGTPSAPGAAVAPTVGGVAHAYVGHCGRAYAYQGHEQARACLGLSWVDDIHWDDIRCSIYSGMMGMGGLLSAGGFASSWLFGVGAPAIGVGSVLSGLGAGASWISGC